MKEINRLRVTQLYCVIIKKRFYNKVYTIRREVYKFHTIWPQKQMNMNTPKSSKQPEKQLSSPRKTTPKPSLSSKQFPSTLRTKTLQQESAQSSLMIKLIQAQISSEDEYQNLLIKNKELEIKILQLQQESQSLKKSYKKASKPLQEIKAKIQSSRLSLIEKQKYLQKFYVHLDNRLKSNMHSNLFGKLQKIQSALQQKYEQQKQTLYSGLASQHQSMQAANQKLLKFKQYRDQLIKQYTQRAIDSSIRNIQNPSEFHINSDSNSNRNGSQKKSVNQKSQKRSAHNTSSKKSHQQKLSSKKNQKDSIKNKQQQQRKNRKQQKQSAKIQAKNQCERLKESIEKLKKQKQMAQKDEKLLKQLLNIEQQHKRHAGYIISGYKKMFTIQYRQMLSSRKKSPSIIRNYFPGNNPIKKSQTSEQKESKKSQIYQSSASIPDVQGMQKTLNKRVAEREVLQRQVKQRNAALQQCKERLNEYIAEYSRLEQQIMRMSNRNQGNSNNKEPNFRMTYGENNNFGNHRSTYTSYQQRSDHLDEDL